MWHAINYYANGKYIDFYPRIPLKQAQQNNLDSHYWNATLRVDPNKRGTLWNAAEIDAVYRCGLVALSLYGNRIEGKQDIYVLTRVLRNNHWLLGE